MSQLNLIGLIIPLNSDGTLVLPVRPQLTGMLTGKIDGNGKVSLQAALIVNAVARLDMQLDLSLQQTATGDWTLIEGNHPQTGSARFTLRDLASPTTGVLALQFGPFQVFANQFDENTIQGEGGTLSVHFPPGDTILTSRAAMPISVSCGSGGFSLDLSVPAVNFEAGFFAASCLTTMDGLDDQGQIIPNDYSVLPLSSSPSQYSLATAPDTIELSFPSDPGQSLHLHTDVLSRPQDLSNASPANPILAAISADSFTLHATLSRTASFVPQFRQIQLRPHPTSGPVSLSAYNYGDSQNNALRISIGGNLDLHLRVGTNARPTGFLVAPVYPRPGAAPTAAFPVTITNVTQSGTLDQIHGMVELHQFKPIAAGALVSEVSTQVGGTSVNWTVPIDPSLIPENVSAAIVSEHTTPWLHFSGQLGVAMRHAKPGTSFRPTVSSDTILAYDFQGLHVALPLLPKEGFQSAPKLLSSHYDDLNQIYSDHQYSLLSSIHETLMTESPLKDGGAIDPRSIVKISKVFDEAMVEPAKADPNSLPASSIKLDTVTLTRGYGPVTIQMTLPADVTPDYVILRTGDPDTIITPADLTFALDNGGLGKCDGSPSPPGNVEGIVKLSSRFALSDIFANENLGQALADPQFLAHYVDSTVLEPGWIGLILFSVPIDFLGPLIPAGTLRLQYLALTPQKGQTLSVNARLQWQNTDVSTPPMTDDNESRFQMKSIDAVWYDSELTVLHALGSLQFGSFFGVPYNSASQTGDGPVVEISGSVNLADQTIRFIGTLPEPLPLLPNDLTFGPVEQVSVESADLILNSDRTSTFLVSGSVAFRELVPFTLGGDDTTVKFKDLGIHFATPTSTAPQWAAITYPSFDLKLNSSPFRLGFLELKPESFCVDFSGGGGFDWNSLSTVKAPDNQNTFKPAFRCDLSLELMALPELALKSVDRLTLDFTIGLGLNGNKRWDSANLIIKLRAISFDNLHFDLLRFLELDCDHAEFGTRNNVTSLEFAGVTLRILGTTLVNGLSMFLYSSPAGSGFFGYLPTATITTAVYWVIVGHNVSMKSVASRLMSVDAPTTADDNQQIGKDIVLAVSNNEFLPGADAISSGGWVFAAGLNFFGLVQGKFLFADHAYYGACLRGGVLDEWFGEGFAISVLYVKGTRPDQDSFLTSVRVPMVVTDTFAFLGGVISVEIVMNGGFTLDVGFPWLAPDGSRSWDRAFGAIVTPYQGQGGFYIRWYNLSAQVGNARGLLLAGGYAVEFGLGGSFGGEEFTVWAKIGLYAILEGQVYFETGRGLRGIRYAGAEGILGQAAGELNWWIISLRVEITISAEVGLILQWGRFAPVADGSDPSGGPVIIEADFTVYASASAQACIGVGFISVCAGISVTLPLRFSYQFQLKG